MTDPRLAFVGSTTAADTGLVMGLLGGSSIHIIVSPHASASRAGQALTYQLTTLLVRLFDHVQITGDEAAPAALAVPLPPGPFLPALRALLPTLRPLEPGPIQRTVMVLIGTGAPQSADLYLGATGWSARLSRTAPQVVADTPNVLGALAAGTLGAAEVFKLLFAPYLLGAVTVPDYTLSLLTYHAADADPEPSLPDSIAVDAVLFGCGSVGCALLQGIACLPQVRGRLVIVDNGRFDTRNPYKYALLDWESAAGGVKKAPWAQQRLAALKGDTLQVLAYDGTVDAYVATLPSDYQLPVAIAAVDNREARLHIQDALPKTIVNAGVDGTVAEVSRHIFGTGPCLACLQLGADLESWDTRPIAEATGLSPDRVYALLSRHEDLTAEDIARMRQSGRLSGDLLAAVDSYLGQPLDSLWNRVAYSEATIQPPSGSPKVRVTTAFVSAFAGLLVLSEWLKEAIPALGAYRVNNSYRQDLLGIPADGTYRYERDDKGWCLCHSPFRLAIYRDKYGAAEGPPEGTP